MNPWILLAVLVLIALAAPRYGADSRGLRPGEAPPPGRPTPWGDLVAAARWARRHSTPARRPEGGVPACAAVRP